MSVRKGVARGLAVMGAGQALAQALSMLKNIVVARLLGPEDWGVAATFWVALTLLDAVSTLATDRQVVQAEDGGEDRFLGTAHALQAARGAVAGLVVFSLSWVAAWAFDTRHALWAYQLIALVPVIRGFSHLGMYAQQREMRFGSTVHVDVWPQVIALALGAPLAWQMGTYGAALWMILGQTAATCVLSHAVAGTRYRWSWDREAAGRMLRFGVPLMVNGGLMFLIFQGDQTAIGVRYSKETLGFYAAAAVVASIPTMLAARVASTALLPPLSRAQGDARVFERRVRGTVEALALVGGVAGIGMALLGPWAMVVMYGKEYAGASGLIGVLGVMSALRILRVGPTLAAMARGDTVNSMVGNMWRSAALVGVVVVAWQRLDVWWIGLAGVAGEVVSLWVSCDRLRRKQGVGLGASFVPSVVALGVMAGALVVDLKAGGLGFWLGSGLTAGMACALVVVMAVVCPGVVEELRGGVALVRSMAGRALGRGVSA